MRLYDFITTHIESIMQDWEDFARTIEPPALTMDNQALRDHAMQMLNAIALDLANHQSDKTQAEKSKGNGKRLSDEDTASETHAAARLASGYTVEQLVSEYRALRASVLKHWAEHAGRGVVTAPEDVTRFNEAVDQLLAESVARYAKLVKQAQHMMMAVLAHDLRNPLGATINSSTYLMRAPDMPPGCLQAATRIHKSSVRMGLLVEDLIDFTRSNLGATLPFSPRAMDLGVVCAACVDELRTLHIDRRIELDCHGALDGIWDENRMAQVFSNLIGNALQHGSKDSPVRVRVRADEKNQVVATVWNDGAPIPFHKMQSIFEPLVRYAARLADAPAPTKNLSMGLGLYITREVVLGHGGAISVDSTAETGTAFTVRLPKTPRIMDSTAKT